MPYAAPPASASLVSSPYRAFAEALADEAGALGRRWFRQPLAVDSKADESPVTLADREIEAMIRDRIAQTFPDHGMLGEEHGRDRLDAHHVWVIDPIDGTRSFISGWPIWGFLLALLEDGRPRLGLIDMPALGERWIGGESRPTTLQTRDNGPEPCRTRACASLEEATFYTTSPFYFAPGDWPRVERIARATRTPRFGGDCYGYGLLASGHVDLVIESQLQPFDYLSLLPVVEGAGGVITDWAGQPLDMQSDGRVVAAATPALHAQALGMLTEEA